MDKLSYERGRGFSSRNLMLTALFSAIYVAYAYVSSVLGGGVTHALDSDLVRSALFVLLAGLTMKFGLSIIMGAVSGAIFSLIIPAPFGFVYLFPSVFLYGLTYDLYMRLAGFPTHATKNKHVITATIISSVLMSIVALALLTWLAVIPPEGLIYAWIFGILGDIVVGLIGSVIGLRILKYPPIKAA